MPAILKSFAIASVTAMLAPGAAHGQAPGKAESLAAWDSIVPILQHPRCLNCHQETSPRQGDARRKHIPLVVRGKGNHGVSAMQCGNCHNEVNNTTSGVPGAPHWSLAPASMRWEGLSPAQLCAQLKDKQRNGQRDGAALVKHMASDALVLWGWNPGGKLAPVPLPHKDFVQLLNIWTAGGMACPG